MDAAKWINELSAGENIETTICDHDAEDRATLERFGISTEPAEKDVATGLEEMRSRLRLRPCSDGTSRPKLRFMRDSLVQLDVRLDKRGRPTSTPGEFESYCWREGRGGEKTDEPIKRDDHGMDATRYLAKWMGRESGDPMTIEWVGGSW
jgi:phage terminase large subunit